MKFLHCDFAPYQNQIFATISANLICLVHGAAIGWLSPMLLILKSPELSPLSSGAITIDEVSWLGALFPVGGICGNICCGFIANNYGRKKALAFLALPQATFWLLVMFGNHVNYLYAARTIAGIAGGGIFVTLPIYITEISSKEIRGSLGSVLVFAVNIGTLVGFIVGAQFDYITVPKIFICMPIIYFLCILYLPETPQYLLQNGNEIESRSSLQFYRHISKLDSKSVKFDLVFDEMKNHLKETNIEDKITFSDFNNSKARKALILSLCLVTINILSGCFVIINYAASIFETTGSDIAPNISAIIIAVSQIFGTYLSLILADRLARKKLLAITTSCGSVAFIVTTIFIILANNYDYLKSLVSWGPIVSVSIAICCLSAGVIPFTFVVMAELLPQKIKPLSFSLCNVFLNILGFTLLKLVPIMMAELGLLVVMAFCSVVCICGTIFFIYILPETRDKYV